MLQSFEEYSIIIIFLTLIHSTDEYSQGDWLRTGDLLTSDTRKLPCSKHRFSLMEKQITNTPHNRDLQKGSLWEGERLLRMGSRKTSDRLALLCKESTFNFLIVLNLFQRWSFSLVSAFIFVVFCGFSLWSFSGLQIWILGLFILRIFCCFLRNVCILRP